MLDHVLACEMYPYTLNYAGNAYPRDRWKGLGLEISYCRLCLQIWVCVALQLKFTYVAYPVEHVVVVL